MSPAKCVQVSLDHRQTCRYITGDAFARYKTIQQVDCIVTGCSTYIQCDETQCCVKKRPNIYHNINDHI